MSTTSDTNAGGSVAGFIYQIYYYLYRLLTIGVDEVVSLEKFEDVGVEKDKSKTYYQLKHTSKFTESKVERMRDRDTDLWKTLSMWVDKIKEGRDEDEQKAWIAERGGQGTGTCPNLKNQRFAYLFPHSVLKWNVFMNLRKRRFGVPFGNSVVFCSGHKEDINNGKVYIEI